MGRSEHHGKNCTEDVRLEGRHLTLHKHAVSLISDGWPPGIPLHQMKYQNGPRTRYVGTLGRQQLPLRLPPSAPIHGIPAKQRRDADIVEMVVDPLLTIKFSTTACTIRNFGFDPS